MITWWLICRMLPRRARPTPNSFRSAPWDG